MRSKRIGDRISALVISLVTAIHAISKCLIIIIIIKACLIKSVAYFKRFRHRWYESTGVSDGFGFNPRGSWLPY